MPLFSSLGDRVLLFLCMSEKALTKTNLLMTIVVPNGSNDNGGNDDDKNNNKNKSPIVQN